MYFGFIKKGLFDIGYNILDLLFGLLNIVPH